MSNANRTYIAIDLKSFYASVECVERGLDPLNTNLVVADKSRTDKTICLAVSPTLKTYGIKGRARLFEVVQRIKEVNNSRRQQTPYRRLCGKSVYNNELNEHADWEVDYLVAPPRMAYYIEYSTRIYKIYLKYIAPEDIHVYSIDEVMIDVTTYLKTYKMTAHELAITIIRDILKKTGITATAGIGTNLYLCKVAMDIVAKHIPADKDGVRIAELDEMSYRQQLWTHQPLTDFWRVGKGIQQRLAPYGIRTMGDIAQVSLRNEDFLYQLFGVNAELLIDHAWGWEPCTMDLVKSYKPETNSLSSGQVLTCAYDVKKARVVIKEMAEAMALELLEKQLVTDQLAMTVGYDVQSLTNPAIASTYQSETTIDHYGRRVPKHAHGSINLNRPTFSSSIITKAATELYDRIINPTLLVRRMNLTVNRVIHEKQVTCQHKAEQLDLFTDYEALEQAQKAEQTILSKERKLMETTLALKKRFGKNSLLKGINFKEGATARERNKQIGGHKA